MARLTLAEAAVKLGVSTRTLRRRIREGTVYAALEDGKYYLDGTEVDRLFNVSGQVDRSRKAVSIDKARRPTETITLNKVEYDSLMSRLGFLEGQRQLLLEHKETVEAKERELARARQRVIELQAEIEAKESESREKVAELEAELGKLKKRSWQKFKDWFWGRES